MSDLRKNFGYQIAYQILLSILPFITSPYISRILGSEGIGIYSYTFSIVTYFQIFAALGIENYGNRLIAKSRDNSEALNKAFSSLFLLHTGLTAVVIFAYCIFVFYFSDGDRTISIIQGLYLVAELLNINWFYFGIEKIKLTVVRNAIIKILTVISVFVFVKTASDLWKYVLILAVGTVLSNGSVWVFLPRYIQFKKPTLREMLRHFKPLLVLFFSVLAIYVFSYMDKIMIGALSSKSQLGFYENAWKMIEFPAQIVTALGIVMLPRMSYLIAHGEDETYQRYMNRSLRFSLFAAFAIASGVSAIANDFSIIFWGPDFAASGTIMMVMAPAIVIISINSVLRTEYLIPKDHDKIYLFAMIAGAVINLALNALLIPKYGANGAGFATMVSYLGICLVQTIYSCRELSIKADLIQTIPYFVISAVMFVVVRFISKAMGASVLSLSVECITGAIFYLSGCFVYAKITHDGLLLDIYRQAGRLLHRGS